MKKFELHILVDEDALGEAITAITPLIVAQRAVLGTIAPWAPSEPTGAPRRKKNTRGTQPVASTRLGLYVLEALQTGECSVADISSYIAARGYSGSSASPCLRKLVESGHVVRLDGRRYRLATHSGA